MVTIAELRAKHNKMSQRELAKELGVTQTSISNWEKDQTKISGVCGRLMCCLKNEQETYEELNRRLPGIGDTVTTPDGIQGNVQSVNVLRQLVKVVVEIGDEKEIQEFPVGELKFRSRKKKVKVSEQELKELKDLEDKKGDSKLDD